MKEHLICDNCQQKLQIPSNIPFHKIATTMVNEGFNVMVIGEGQYIVQCKDCGVQMKYDKEE